MKHRKHSLDSFNRDYKNILVDILIAFDCFCRNNSLKYSLTGGTLLGAVRYGGIIPWDDDIDVVMPRADYNRFLELSQKGISDRFGVVSPYNHKRYYIGFSKVIDLNTSLIETKDFKNSLLGVYVDVFPLDEVPANDEEAEELFLRYKSIMERVRSICYTPSFYDLFKRNKVIGIKSYVKSILIRTFCNSQSLAIKADRMISNMSFKPSDYLRIYSGYVDSHSHQMIPKEWFEEYEDILFEGHFFKAIKQKEKFLTLLFGDYLTPPPAEDRKPHHSRYYVNLKQRKSLLMIRKLGY